jgi:hypothetical protein
VFDDDDDEELACGLLIIAAINSHCFSIIGFHHLVLVLLKKLR